MAVIKKRVEKYKPIEVIYKRKSIKVSYLGKEDQELDNKVIQFFDELGFERCFESYDFLDKEKKIAFEERFPAT